MHRLPNSIKTGIGFGLTSAVITTLGLMVGLQASTESKMVVVGGIITIAVADAFSDALGIHISEEAKNNHSNNHKEIWLSTIVTFFAKFLFAMTFLIPMLLFDIRQAIVISVIWGVSILAILSYLISEGNRSSRLSVVSEHVFIAMVVIGLTHYLGHFINYYID